MEQDVPLLQQDTAIGFSKYVTEKDDYSFISKRKIIQKI